MYLIDFKVLIYKNPLFGRIDFCFVFSNFMRKLNDRQKKEEDFVPFVMTPNKSYRFLMIIIIVIHKMFRALN